MPDHGNANGIERKGRRRIVLHIGAEKTGTTSIQAWFANQRERWESLGVLYPRAAGVRNHMRLAHWAHDEAAGAPGGPHAEFPAELAAECARTRAATIVLSNEHCHSRLTGVGQIRRLQELLASLADDIRVVLYLRRQDRLAVSLFSTALKMGHAPLSILPSLEQGLPYYYDFHAVVRNWSAVFGEKRLDVRLFDTRAFEEGSLLRDFATAAGLPASAGIPEPVRDNESLTEPAQRFLHGLNAGPQLPGGRQGPARRDVVDLLARRYAGRGMQPSRADAEYFYAAFRDSNEHVRRTCFPDRPPPLFDEDFGEYPEMGAIPGPATPEQFAEVFSHLWTCRTLQIDALRTRAPT